MINGNACFADFNKNWGISVFDTRNTLTRNAAQPNGWANEIHPYFTGFTALANKFLTNLQAVPQFKSRI